MIDDITANGEVPILEENDPEDLELGLLGALFDGWVASFEFRGLDVVRERGFIAAKHPVTGSTLCGKMHMKGATVTEAHEWLEHKAEHYQLPA